MCFGYSCVPRVCLPVRAVQRLPSMSKAGDSMLSRYWEENTQSKKIKQNKDGTRKLEAKDGNICMSQTMKRCLNSFVLQESNQNHGQEYFLHIRSVNISSYQSLVRKQNCSYFIFAYSFSHVAVRFVVLSHIHARQGCYLWAILPTFSNHGTVNIMALGERFGIANTVECMYPWLGFRFWTFILISPQDTCIRILFFFF